jgi:outer membrane protein assembly factor BamB
MVTCENVLQSESASPLVADIAGRGQVVMPHGDGWVRSYDPQTGRLLWECDSNPKESVYSPYGRANRNYFLSTPVLYEDRLYIANGHEPEHGGGDGRLLCIDPTRSGDISAELAVDKDGKVIPPRRIQNIDPAAGERTIPNPNSGVVWVFADQHATKYRWHHGMHRAVASVAIHDGQLVVPDFEGALHCLDARSGLPHWHYDLVAGAWAAPLIVDDKVFVATDDGTMRIFKLDTSTRRGELAEKYESPEPIAELDMGSTYFVVAPVFANGVLYVTTRSTLYAIESPALE